MPTPEEATSSTATPSFKELGVIEPLLEALDQMSFKTPTSIQAEVLPHALKGCDIIGVAETGSGKTAAFALPVLQKLWESPRSLFACVIVPTRELAMQVSQHFEALGASIGVRCAVIIGGTDEVAQAIALARGPHVVVATPGRLLYHLEKTKGFSLRTIQYLILDEADRLLDMDFGPILDKILKVIPKERHTYLFSATMTTKVAKLQRASLSNPVRVEVSKRYATVSTLLQYYLLTAHKFKESYLVGVCNDLAQNSIIIFTRTVNDCQKISMVLRTLGFPAIAIHGQMSQTARLGAIAKFKAGSSKVLVATDVASRGLDMPSVDIVINFDIPSHSKDYIHRVGRTARAGRAGKAITFVTQYDVEHIQRIEQVLGEKLALWPTDEESIALLRERVEEAGRLAIRELKELAKEGKGRKRHRDDEVGGKDDVDRDDDVVEAGMPVKKQKSKRR